ncbi:SubName: Full=Uncharacterized protein {ECO:0000313/EMBL:CCA73264.1} [Serendipita indica DSM 11827]|uniref:Holocytochrome c-type synthase n=1 Tax=Serendipita indica (strain DSM 11827) TaxID=1109443 RepID=G4TPM1_SERID|nr:SubName: Full=Uncharacterized protein {ECO:0000313/EMBL:CCA73264.1} [Serendipita indica DSM 11827]CCA73264.1 hypothetical protein PIIN_07219 [Serendipita indica DSM 11827]
MEDKPSSSSSKPGQNLKDAIPGDRNATDMAWEQVIRWEAMHGGGLKCGGIRLVSFAKFKKNRSPSAMWAVFMGHKPPYERQDWIIDRCGHVNRYIIDFYRRPRDPKDPNSPEDKLVVYARPSVRDWDGAKLRMRRGWRRLVAKLTFGRYGFTDY